MKIFVVNHPASEPRYIGKGYSPLSVGWNQEESHHRKYIARSGKIVDLSNGAVVPRDRLLFWGEYEPASIYTPVSSRKTRVKALHEFLVPVGARFRNIPVINVLGSCYNTDPYVFGDEFYYTCCKYIDKESYCPGDVILFGCLKQSIRQIFELLELDTVLVVKELRPASIFPIEDNFYKASIIPKILSGEPLHPVVVGRGFSNVNTPFSFVPCCKDQEDFGDKPVIDLSRLNIKGLMRGRGLIHPVTASTDVWQLILDAVKGYDLAVSFDPIK